MKRLLTPSLTIALAGLCFAQDTPKVEPAPDSPPEPAPSKVEPAPDKPDKPAEPAPKPAAPKVIPISDTAALKAAIGKYVTVTGKVRAHDRSPKTSAVRIWFDGAADAVVAIDGDAYDSLEGWGLDEIEGQVRFARGKVSEDVGLLMINIYKPAFLTASADKIPKPAKPAKPGDKPEEVTYEPASPGAVLPVDPGEADLKPKFETASAKVILPKFGASQADMIVTGVTAEIMDKPESGPMQATFELKPKIDPKPMVGAMTFLPKRHQSAGWPIHKTAHFVIDEVLADSAPPNFAAAVLIECMLTGVEIPENVVFFGGLTGAGKISRSGDKARSDTSYVEAVALAAASVVPEQPEEEDKRSRSAFAPAGPKVENSAILITGKVPEGALDDFVLDEDWLTLNSAVVLSCGTFDEVMAVLRGLNSSDALGKSITDLVEAQGVLRERSVRMLTNDAIWARVVAAGKAFPGNATAYAYARVRTKKVAKTYSLDRCIAHIESHVDRAPEFAKLKDRDIRKGIRELKGEMGSIEAKIHPDAEALFEAAEEFIDESEDKMSAEAKIDRKSDDEVSERIILSHKEARQRYSEALAAAKKKVSAPAP